MEYTVVSGSSIEYVVEVVNDMIQEGWIPQGSIAVSQSGNYVRFYQAMILQPSLDIKFK